MGAEKLLAKQKKCVFGQTLEKYLGHIVEGVSLCTEPDKVEAIRTWPKLTKVKKPQIFLSLTHYYVQYIKHYTDVTAPLLDLASPKQPWARGTAQDAACARLRELLCNPPVLKLPDFKMSFMIDTDVYKNAIGAVMLQ